jgi:phage terminase small subunit
VGRPRKPRALKILKGTLQKCRDRPEPEFPLVTSDGLEPPDWLVDPEAVRFWKWMAGLLTNSHVLTEPDQVALGHLANLHADCVQLYRAKRAPSVGQLGHLRIYLTEFGMTPASRSKARPVGDGKAVNPFGQLAKTK